MEMHFSACGKVGLREISGDEDRRKKDTAGRGSLSRGVKQSYCMPELETQLVGETGQHILAIPLGKTEPALYRIS